MPVCGAIPSGVAFTISATGPSGKQAGKAGPVQAACPDGRAQVAGEGFRLVDPPGGDGEFPAFLGQGIDDRPGGPAGAQDQRPLLTGGPAGRGRGEGAQAEGETRDVGVVAGQETFLAEDGIDRAGCPGQRGQPVEAGEDGLLVRDGDIQPGQIAGAHPLEQAGQGLFPGGQGRDGIQPVLARQAERIQGGCVQDRRQAVLQGPPDQPEADGFDRPLVSTS